MITVDTEKEHGADTAGGVAVPAPGWTVGGSPDRRSLTSLAGESVETEVGSRFLTLYLLALESNVQVPRGCGTRPIGAAHHIGCGGGWHRPKNQ